MQSMSNSSPHSRIAWYDSPRKKANSLRISSSVKSWSTPQILKQKIRFLRCQFFNLKLKKKNFIRNLKKNSYLSATAWTLSLFFDSQTTTDGKFVFQSRYDVSTTKLIALWWNASNADRIKNADPTHDKTIDTNQNIRSKKVIFSSIINLTPCNDEFSKNSFRISLQ